MIDDGTILSVTARKLGSTLAADASATDTTITVNDAADFDPYGGSLTLDGSTVLAYSTVDEDSGEITLTDPLPADAADGDRVDVWDAGTGEVGVETRAMVALSGEYGNDDALDCVVAQSLAPLLEEGIRDPAGREAVRLELQGLDWVVTDVRGKRARVKPSAGGQTSAGNLSRIIVGVNIDAALLTGSSYTITAWDFTSELVGSALSLYSPDNGTIFALESGVYSLTMHLAVNGIDTAADDCTVALRAFGPWLSPDGPVVCKLRGGDISGASSPHWGASASMTYYVDVSGDFTNNAVLSLRYANLDPAVTSVDVQVELILLAAA